MKVLSVNKSWIIDNSNRLDAKPYLSEGRTSTMKILKSPLGYNHLKTVTRDIFNGPRFKRYYVEDYCKGVPFMGSSDMLRANLNNLKYISKKYSNNLEQLKLSEHWILVSCSGTIGNTVFTNTDFKNKTASQHIMRIIPLNVKESGYLYAYLSSKYGYHLLTQGTYGAVIQHIEPHHIENLPVPILPKDKQQLIHQLIVDSANLRVEANKLLKEAINYFAFLDSTYRVGTSSIKIISSSLINNISKRFDANYNIINSNVEKIKLEQNINLVKIKDLTEKIFIGPRSKRNYIDNGTPFLSTSEMQKANPTKTEKFVNQFTGKDFQVKEGWLLTTRSGTLGDTIYTLPCINDYAVSEDAIRIQFKQNPTLTNKYVYAFLKSNLGRNSLLAGSYGSVILHLNEDYVGNIEVPVLEKKEINEIENLINLHIYNLNDAILKENQAINLIEKEIDEWQ